MMLSAIFRSIGLHTPTSTGEKLNKIQYGVSKGAFVTLQDGPDRVFIAEGLETALSIKESGVVGKVVASLGIHNIANYGGSEKEIILCADNDDHKPDSKTHQVIEKIQGQFEVQGRDVELIKPATPGHDFNDVLKEQGIKCIEGYVKDYPSDSLSKDLTSQTIDGEDNIKEKDEPQSYADLILSDLEEKVRIIKRHGESCLTDRERENFANYMEKLENDEKFYNQIKNLNPELSKEIDNLRTVNLDKDFCY